jgi:hypothetical protein
MGTNSFVNLPTVGVGYAATVLASTPTQLTSFTTLGPITEGGYSDGQIAYIDSTGITYVLRLAVGAPDGLTIIATNDDATRQWVAVSGSTPSWNINTTRVYAVDFVNGIDTNIGYADPASTSASDYAAACQLAGSRALKTIAGLAAIFPSFGNDHKVEIVFANGGVNTVETYATALTAVLGAMTAYAAFDCRATGTNPTAGCSAFDGSINDCTYLGAITGTGLNVNGYNPTGSPTTSTVQCILNGGGAPAFAAEPAIPCGLRVRFSIMTPTVALRNVCRTISKVSGGDTLVWSTALPAVPASNDVFYIEQAGVAIPGVILSASLMAGAARADFAGISFTVSTTFDNGSWLFGFCQFTQWFEATNQTFFQATLYQHPVLGNLTVGSSRTSGTFSSSRSVPSLSACTLASGGTFTSPCSLSNVGGVTYGNALTITDPQCQTANPSFGSTAAIVGVGPRVLMGGLVISGTGSIRIDQLDSSNTPIPSAGIYLGANEYSQRLLIDFGSANANTAITGTANGVAGMYTAFARGLTVILNGAHPPTITGTFADVYLSTNLGVFWTNIVNSGLGFRENGNNQYICTNGFGAASQVASTDKLKFSGTLLGGGGAVFCYLADDGDLTPGSNNTSPINYPLDGGFITRILVKPRVNTMTHNCTATVYQNGVATGMTVTIPASSTTVVAAFPSTNTVFMFEDVLDLRLDNPSADAGHTLSVAVVVTVS